MDTLKQSLEQLTLLGYKPGDRVYIRLIAGKGFDIEKDRLYPYSGYLTLLSGGGCSFTRLNSKAKGGGEKFTVRDGHQYLLKENLRGYGVFLVPNPGGETDESITECRSLFYECDDISKDEQWERMNRLPHEPSMVIDTRKSLHVYYRLDDTGVEGWRSRQKRLIQQMDSDPAIHNEARLMRLAGYYHQKAGADPYPITIAQITGEIHSRAKFEEALPALDESKWADEVRVSEADRLARLEAAKARREANKSIDRLESFPLEICLSKDDRELIDRGISEGGRNTNGVKLAKNLIGTANYLSAAGYNYSGDARSLFDEYCDRCSPPISDRERESIWRSASAGNPTPSLSDEAIENCIKAYRRKDRLPFAKLATGAKKQTLWERLTAFVGGCKDTKKVQIQKSSPKTVDGDKKRVYDRSDRLKVWAKNKGFMLDTSPTGDGKSFDVSNLTPKDFGVEVLIYVTSDPRNATNPGFKDWALLGGRHDGLTINPLGEIRRRKQNESYSLTTTGANCSRAQTLAAIASKNIAGGNTSDVICSGCPSWGACIIPSSNPKKKSGISYLGDRIQALKADRFIAHPLTLPDPGDGEIGFDYSKVAFIWDESEIVFNSQKTIKVEVSDIKDTIARLMGEADLFDRCRPLLSKLLDLTTAEQPNRYGYDGAYLARELSPLLPEDLRLDDLKKRLEPDLSFLNPLEEYGENIANLPYEEKRRFAESDQTLSDHATKNLLKQWLPETIEALRGGGYLSLNYGVLTVSVADERLRTIALSTDHNLFLSATETTENLAKRLGAKPEDIETVTTGDGLPDNIDYRQVTDLGRLGISRGKQQLKRVQAILDHYKELDGDNTAIISFKPRPLRKSNKRPPLLDKDNTSIISDPDRLYHFVHSQGTNLAAGKKRLIIDGIPCPNLSSLKHDYFAITGRSPTLWNPDLKESENTEDFKLYIRHRIATLVKQEIGRLRANRYLDQRFEVIFLTDYEFLTDIIPSNLIVELKAYQITPAAESVGDRTRRLIRETVDKLLKEGKRVSERAIAQITGLHRNTINRLRSFLDEVIRLATSTTRSISSKCGHPQTGDESTLETINDCFLAAGEWEILDFLNDCLDALGDNPETWGDFWAAITPENQKRILPRLLLISDGGGYETGG
ncbi:MAG: hypothetical protein N5P05_004598 [Chroococcopsis gigantea SAG 12.99]|nr:hypothetical protein [Chroococcopsis gigantea SAG 12.99]